MIDMKYFRHLLVVLAITLTGTLAEAQVGSSRSADEMIASLDKDGDGKLRPEEIPPPARASVHRIAKQANLDTAKPLSIKKLRKSLRENGQLDPSDEPKGAESQSSESSASVRGFGEAPQPARALGFGTGATNLEARHDPDIIRYVDRLLERYDANDNQVLDADEWSRIPWTSDPRVSDLDGNSRLSKAELCRRVAHRWGRQGSPQSEAAAETKAGTSASLAKSTPQAQSTANREQMRKYAQALLRQHDKNKNGVLERNEWKKMPNRPEEADVDRNGIITVDELATRLEKYSKDKVGSGRKLSKSSKDSAKYAGKSGRTSRNKSARKSYRFLTPLERLPEGLPDWFARNDRDGDGQIAMVEFSSVWSKAKARDFAEHDLDGDGFITPDECLAKTKS